MRAPSCEVHLASLIRQHMAIIIVASHTESSTISSDGLQTCMLHGGQGVHPLQSRYRWMVGWPRPLVYLLHCDVP